MARTNQERAGQGLGSLSSASDLVDFARRWSQQMASEGRIYHDPNIQNEIQNWQTFGDNVGRGTSADAIHEAFMNSATHRHEILYPDYTQVGIGAVWAGDTLYVTEVFRQPSAPAAAPAHHVTAQATPAPAPAPRPVRAAAVTAPAPAPAPTTTTSAPAAEGTATIVASVTQVAPVATSVVPQLPLAPRRVSSSLSTVSRARRPAMLVVGAAVLFAAMAGVQLAALRRLRPAAS